MKNAIATVQTWNGALIVLIIKIKNV